MLIYLVIIKFVFNTVMFSYFSKYLIVCLFKFYVGKLTLITKLISGQVTRSDCCSVLFFQWKSDSVKALWREVNNLGSAVDRMHSFKIASLYLLYVTIKPLPH